jgi:hypothetical protein
MHALKQEKEERSKDREIRQRDEDDLGHMASSGSINPKNERRSRYNSVQNCSSGALTFGVGPTAVVHDAMDK